jgi:hypothetical protein
VKDEGVYDTSNAQPNTEQSDPTGIGVGSRTDAGANKRDPISASPTIGHTIAGRTIDGDEQPRDSPGDDPGE